VPAGTKVGIARVRKAFAIKEIAPVAEEIVPQMSSELPGSDIEVTPECYQDDLSDEEAALFAGIGNDPIVLADEIRTADDWRERAEKAPLNGNHGFSLLRV
jgi:hypothetical protein